MLCNYLQNVAAITYIFVLQLSTFLFYNKQFGVLFAVGTYKFGNCFANGRKIITISVFLMLFLLYIGENLQYSIFPYIAVFYGYGWKESIASSNRVYTQGRQMSI